MNTEPRALQVVLVVVTILTASTLSSNVMAEEEGGFWQRVTCPACAYSAEVPALGNTVFSNLDASGGRVQNYVEGPDAFRGDDYFALRENLYWLEVSVHLEAEIRLRSPEATCADKPIPLGPELQGFWCRTDDHLETDATYSHVARFHVKGRVYEFRLSDFALAPDDVRRILESVSIDDVEVH